MRKALERPVRMIPYAVRKRLLSALMREMWEEVASGPLGERIRLESSGRQALAESARAVGIDGFLAKGKWGTFQSSARDTVMLPIYAETGVWEAGCNQLLIDFFAGKAGTYIDIGANIGLTTVPVAKNEQVKCIAFEPDPTNHANLVENVRRNCPNDNVLIQNLALFDKRTTLAMSLSPDNMGDHRVASPHDHDRLSIDVNAAPLDEVISSREKPLAVKIDVQGAEPAVVRGGRSILQQADLALLEFCPFMIERLGENPSAVYEFLATFSSVSVLEVNTERGCSFVSAAEAVDFLRRSFLQQKGREDWYVDIYASRAPGFSFEPYLRH